MKKIIPLVLILGLIEMSCGETKKEVSNKAMTNNKIESNKKGK